MCLSPQLKLKSMKNKRNQKSKAPYFPRQSAFSFYYTIEICELPHNHRDLQAQFQNWSPQLLPLNFPFWCFWFTHKSICTVRKRAKNHCLAVTYKTGEQSQSLLSSNTMRPSFKTGSWLFCVLTIQPYISGTVVSVSSTPPQ